MGYNLYRGTTPGKRGEKPLNAEPLRTNAYRDTAVGVRSQQLANLLADPEIRTELARALFAGNATVDEAVDLDTSDTAGQDLEPQVQHSSIPHLSRHAALAAMAKLKEHTK